MWQQPGQGQLDRWTCLWCLDTAPISSLSRGVETSLSSCPNAIFALRLDVSHLIDAIQYLSICRVVHVLPSQKIGLETYGCKAQCRKDDDGFTHALWCVVMDRSDVRGKAGVESPGKGAFVVGEERCHDSARETCCRGWQAARAPGQAVVSIGTAMAMVEVSAQPNGNTTR